MASIGDIVAYLRMDSKNFTSNARAASAQTKGLNTQFGLMAKSAGRGALALAGVGGGMAIAGKALSNSQGFERALTRSVAIQGASVEQSERMREAALSVSETTKFSATEAAQAFYFLASAGLTVEEQLNSIGEVAKFAQAGNFDMATATDLLTDAQSAMGLSAGTAAEKLANLKLVGDTLVRAETLANASTQQFSEAMTNGAAVAARTYGVSLAETIATLAVFADQGAKGAEAGTKFGIVLRDLTTKSLKQKEAFAAAGVEIFDQQGKFLGVANAIKELTKLMDGLSDAEKKAELMALGFSDKSVGAIQMLLGTSEKLEGFIATLSDVGGTMERIADNSVTKLDQSLNEMNGQFDRFSQHIVGPVMENVFVPALTAMNDAVAGLKKLAEDSARFAFGVSKQDIAGASPVQENIEVIPTQQAIRERAGRDAQRLGPVRLNGPAPPAGTDGASLGSGPGGAATAAAISAQNELLSQQLEELKKLNSDTETI